MCLWDTNQVSQKGAPTLKIEKAHLKTINDIKFSNLEGNILGTASDDSHYKLWDTRSLKD